jgi:F-type H+-transporting ATPase subunit epsilon
MAATHELTLRVITPDEIVLDTSASAVRIPGVDGSIGILPRHAPMVAALDIGMLRYRSGGKEHYLYVSDGFAEVRDNTLRLVCEAGSPATEIDEARARAAEKRARERLAMAHEGGKGASEIDVLRAEAALRRALARLHVLGYADREQRGR